jgi:hypothetical protein
LMTPFKLSFHLICESNWIESPLKLVDKLTPSDRTMHNKAR